MAPQQHPAMPPRAPINGTQQCHSSMPPSNSTPARYSLPDPNRDRLRPAFPHKLILSRQLPQILRTKHLVSKHLFSLIFKTSAKQTEAAPANSCCINHSDICARSVQNKYRHPTSIHFISLSISIQYYPVLDADSSNDVVTMTP